MLLSNFPNYFVLYFVIASLLILPISTSLGGPPGPKNYQIKKFNFLHFQIPESPNTFAANEMDHELYLITTSGGYRDMVTNLTILDSEDGHIKSNTKIGPPAQLFFNSASGHLYLLPAEARENLTVGIYDTKIHSLSGQINITSPISVSAHSVIATFDSENNRLYVIKEEYSPEKASNIKELYLLDDGKQNFKRLGTCCNFSSSSVSYEAPEEALVNPKLKVIAITDKGAYYNGADYSRGGHIYIFDLKTNTTTNIANVRELQKLIGWDKENRLLVEANNKILSLIPPFYEINYGRLPSYGSSEIIYDKAGDRYFYVLSSSVLAANKGGAIESLIKLNGTHYTSLSGGSEMDPISRNIYVLDGHRISIINSSKF